MSLVTSSILTNTFSPSSIQGLALWYDFYDSNYIQQNSSIMSTITDKSGNNNNASTIILTSATLRSIFYLNNSDINGGGSIYYYSNIMQQCNNGGTIIATCNYSHFRIPVPTRENWSWFVLIKTVIPGNANNNWWDGRGLIDGEIAGATCNDMGMSVIANGRLACGTTGTTIQSGAIVTDGNYQLCEFLRLNTNGLINVYTNGQNFASGTGGVGIRDQPTFLTFGAASVPPGGQATGTFQGSIYEVLMFSTFLSVAERQQIEGYMAWKWGFTQRLPSNHPYRLNPYIIAPDPTPTPIPNNTFLVNVNTFSSIKTLLFPAVSEIPGRMLVLKDNLGYANRNPIYISTQGNDKFQGLGIGGFRTSSNAILSSAYNAWIFQNDGISNWFVTSEYNNTLATYCVEPTIYPSNPKIYMDPATSTFFPTFTSPSISTMPMNMGTYLNFAGSSNGNGNSGLNGQWINYGQQTFNMATNGFAAKLKIMWTNYATWSRVFDFFRGIDGILDMFLTLPALTSNTLRFQYNTGQKSSNERITQVASNIFSTNIIYNITINYLPNIGINGTTVLWVNGINVACNSLNQVKATDRTVSTTVGRSSYPNDQLLCARMYKFAVYDRFLSDAECAYLW